ncbi:hypothetical protein KM043_014588 [Ampulex compressa]|nr:hypothetical protein KM043_014588 [Ampulex compressa]
MPVYLGRNESLRGHAFSAGREYTDDCLFNETLEQHNYNSYSSVRWSTAKKTLYLGLNRHGQPRRVQAKGHNLGRLSAYARVLTQAAPPDRVEALQRHMLGAQHNIRHRHGQQQQQQQQQQHHHHHRGTELAQQTICPALPAQEKDGRDRFRCRKRKKRKKRKRRCRPGEREGPQCQVPEKEEEEEVAGPASRAGCAGCEGPSTGKSKEASGKKVGGSVAQSKKPNLTDGKKRRRKGSPERRGQRESGPAGPKAPRSGPSSSPSRRPSAVEQRTGPSTPRSLARRRTKGTVSGRNDFAATAPSSRRARVQAEETTLYAGENLARPSSGRNDSAGAAPSSTREDEFNRTVPGREDSASKVSSSSKRDLSAGEGSLYGGEGFAPSERKDSVESSSSLKRDSDSDRRTLGRENSTSTVSSSSGDRLVGEETLYSGEKFGRNDTEESPSLSIKEGDVEWTDSRGDDFAARVSSSMRDRLAGEETLYRTDNFTSSARNDSGESTSLSRSDFDATTSRRKDSTTTVSSSKRDRLPGEETLYRRDDFGSSAKIDSGESPFLSRRDGDVDAVALRRKDSTTTVSSSRRDRLAGDETLYRKDDSGESPSLTRRDQSVEKVTLRDADEIARRPSVNNGSSESPSLSIKNDDFNWTLSRSSSFASTVPEGRRNRIIEEETLNGKEDIARHYSGSNDSAKSLTLSRREGNLDSTSSKRDDDVVVSTQSRRDELLREEDSSERNDFATRFSEKTDSIESPSSSGKDESIDSTNFIQRNESPGRTPSSRSNQSTDSSKKIDVATTTASSSRENSTESFLRNNETTERDSSFPRKQSSDLSYVFGTNNATDSTILSQKEDIVDRRSALGKNNTIALRSSRKKQPVESPLSLRKKNSTKSTFSSRSTSSPRQTSSSKRKNSSAVTGPPRKNNLSRPSSSRRMEDSTEGQRSFRRNDSGRRAFLPKKHNFSKSTSSPRSNDSIDPSLSLRKFTALALSSKKHDSGRSSLFPSTEESIRRTSSSRRGDLRKMNKPRPLGSRRTGKALDGSIVLHERTPQSRNNSTKRAFPARKNNLNKSKSSSRSNYSTKSSRKNDSIGSTVPSRKLTESSSRRSDSVRPSLVSNLNESIEYTSVSSRSGFWGRMASIDREAGDGSTVLHEPTIQPTYHIDPPPSATRPDEPRDESTSLETSGEDSLSLEDHFSSTSSSFESIAGVEKPSMSPSLAAPGRHGLIDGKSTEKDDAGSEIHPTSTDGLHLERIAM